MAGALVITMFRPRECRRCGMPCDTPGNHCQSCINELPPLPLSFMQSTVASAIRDLEKAQPTDPVQIALFQMRQLYDAVTPRVLAPQLGTVRFDGAFWGHPEDSSECVGPFVTSAEAGAALINRISGGKDALDR